VSAIRMENEMSEQLASNRYAHVTRRNLNVVRAVERQDSCRLLLDSAAPFRERSHDSLEDPMRLRRRQEHTRDDLNSQFLAVLAHELRNSLCVVRMAAGILKMELPASPAVGKARTLIEHQTALMSRLVEDLLDTSRARNGHLALKCKKIDLCVVAAQALQSVEFTMQQSGHFMTVSLPVGSLWLQGDPARLEQVFVNLLLNAAKYTLSGGNIHLSLEREGGEALVRIRDNGIGIAPDVLPRVFDLFVQADPSSDHRGAGLGIGLALVRNLVDGHGGCVTAASLGLGLGSEFVVRLPMILE
jgi:signal transduction histidine kinase